MAMPMAPVGTISGGKKWRGGRGAQEVCQGIAREASPGPWDRPCRPDHFPAGLAGGGNGAAGGVG